MRNTIFLLLVLFSNCNPVKYTGYDYSFVVNNNTQDSLYFSWDMNYFDHSKNSHISYTLMPNKANEIGKNGSWIGLFNAETDTMYAYFIDLNIERTNSWDSIFNQHKFLSVKKLSKSEFINGNKTIAYP